MASKEKIGWIGTGVMGAPMARHLMDAGYELTVYNHTISKSEPLLSRGAKWASSPAEVAANSDIVFSIVGYPKDVEEITLGENGCLKTLKKGGIICDMTTSSPELARRIAEKAADLGCQSLDAPVTGGDVGARDASLSIFVGGDAFAYEKIYPCLECMGKKILHCGGPGTGQAAKLANQIAVAGVMFSVCESLLFAQEEGLDVAKWRELVCSGAAGSIAMTTLGLRMMKLDYAPGFFVDHFVKDLGLCLEECRKMRLVLPGAELAEELYREIQARGGGSNGTQILISALAELSGKKWRSHS